ncbi:hypothetical protein [Rhizobium cremeum]|nr:hypothetical protein [Rhizobium cremeum]
MNDNLYYAIVGHNTNTNEGLGRLLGLVIAFVVIGGGFFWLIG